MNDKLDELGNEIDDAMVNADELEDAPGAMPKHKIDKLKDVLDDAQNAVDDLEDTEG